MSKSVCELPVEVFASSVQSIIKEGRSAVITAKGASMLPFIHGGTDRLVIEKPVSPSQGDILFCRVSGGRYVIHRAIAVKDGRIVLMGDGNIRGKEYCGEGDVIGKVSGILRPCRRSSAVKCRHAGTFQANGGVSCFDGMSKGRGPDDCGPAKLIRCDSRSFRIKSSLWRRMLPVRRLMLFVYRKLNNY